MNPQPLKKWNNTVRHKRSANRPGVFTLAGNVFGKPNDHSSISIERGPILTCPHEKISGIYIDRLT